MENGQLETIQMGLTSTWKLRVPRNHTPESVPFSLTHSFTNTWQVLMEGI